MSDRNGGLLHGLEEACSASRQHMEVLKTWGLGPKVLCGDCVARAGWSIKMYLGTSWHWPKVDSEECGDDGNSY